MNTLVSSPVNGTSESPPGRSELLYRLAVLLLIGGICATLLSVRALDQTGDSLSYASSAREGKSLFHPHHLLFNGAIRIAYLVLGKLTGYWNVLVAGQLHNLAFLALGLAAIARISSRTLSSPATGLVAVTLCGALNGLMVFSTQVEVYIPAAACLTAAAAVLFDGRLDWRRMLLVAGFWTLSVLYHQTGVLFAVPLIAYLLAQRRRGTLIWASGLVTLAGSTVLATYIAVFLSEDYTDRSFLEFCLWYVENGRATWGSTTNLQLTGLGNLAESQWWALSALPLSRVSIFLIAAALGSLLLLSAMIPTRLWRQRGLLRFSLSWYLTYGLFFWWWLPTEVEFCILMSLPLSLAVIAAVSLLPRDRWRHAALGTLFLAALCGFSVNLRAEILPRHRNLGAGYAAAAKFHDVNSGECLALMRHQTMTNYRFYFARDTDRSFETSRAFHFVHTGQANKLQHRRRNCLIVTSRDVIPRASLRGFTGFKTPEVWLRFVLWIVDERPCADGTGFCVREFRWTQDKSGQAFLVIGKTEQRWKSIHDFFDHWTDSAIPHDPWLKQNLEEWNALHGSQIEEWWREDP